MAMTETEGGSIQINRKDPHETVGHCFQQVYLKSFVSLVNIYTIRQASMLSCVPRGQFDRSRFFSSPPAPLVRRLAAWAYCEREACLQLADSVARGE